MKKRDKIFNLVSIGLISGVVVTANLVAASFAPMITTFLCGTGVSFDSEEFKQASESSDALCQTIAKEGITLLKNENNCLPLSTKKINVMGWSSSDQGFLLSGIGSGSSTINSSKKVTFLSALEDGGFELNDELVSLYNTYDSTNYGYSSSRIPLVEPGISYYSEALMDRAATFSDTALIVISRIAGENVGEIPLTQVKSHGQATDTSRTYLELSTEEEKLIARAEDYFTNVILVLNSTNQMQIPQLKTDDGITACLNVGLLGQSGTKAIPSILSGETNPSGRLTDTWAYDYEDAPSFANYIRDGNHIQYRENIYFGYKWYETADQENYFDNVDNDYGTGYDGVVLYPFGYGLSYSSFEWTLLDSSLANGKSINKDSKITLTFGCKNVGENAGQDTLEIFYTPPYISGQIEKSSVNLLDFIKTASLDPGMEQRDLTITFSAYDLASYDDEDKNNNEHSGYELDEGEYTISFMNNSHELKTMSNNVTSLSYNVSNTLNFVEDTTSGKEVKNRFTGNSAYSGVPLDGSTVFSTTKYLSRDDFEGTYPTTLNVSSANSSKVSIANNYTNSSYDTSTMPTLNADNSLYLATNKDGSKASLDSLKKNKEIVLNKDLLEEIGSDYDSEKLDRLVDQISASEAASVVEDSGFGTPAVESIGKPKLSDYDGPAGFNANTQTTSSSGEWTAYENETLIGQTFSKNIARQMGLSMGIEGNATGLTGWYAPGVNLHRTPFNGRNYEYYSEDGVLSGMMAASVIEGAKANGLTCYLKHLCLSEPGVNSRNLNTWLTEQNYRENYMKPFEIAVKKGGANAIMTAFNFIGGVWSGANYAQNVEILRNEWGFRGSLITDWSSGDNVMNPEKGIRGGNDICLNPNTGNNGAKISQTSATSITCAKLAVKNVIYTYANTYNYAVNYDHSNDSININIGQSSIVEPYAWWIPVLGATDAVIAAGLGVWAFFVLKKKRVPITKDE